VRVGRVVGVVVTFVVAALLVVGAVTGAGIVLNGETAPSPSSDTNDSAYDTASLLLTAVPDDGRVPVPGTTTEKTIVVDLSHGNNVDRASMDPLITALVAGGHDVRFFAGGSTSSFGSSSAEALNRSLSSADAVIIANPVRGYTGAEVAGIEAFADAGGRVLLLGDPPESGSTASVAVPGLPTSGSGTAAAGQPNNVASQFGIAFGAGYLYDMEENANNFAYTYSSATSENDLSAGVDRAVLSDAVPIATSEATTTVLAGRNVSASATRDRGTYPVAVRNGNAIAIGDTWFLSPEGATLADNERFVGNVASFLVAGEKTSSAPQTGTETPSFGQPPTGPPATTPAPASTPPANETTPTGNETEEPGSVTPTPMPTAG
jgi:hypothetical protein